jgi:AcrR family transcriptional regulator
MKSDMSSILNTLEPVGLGPAGPKWQQRKSSQTRVAILEAAIHCLERHGYAQTTMQLIAEVAKISRGAMTHHYASKLELISAVIDYLFYRRVAIFEKKIGSLTDKQRIVENLGIEQAWEAYFTREHKAYLELIVAARTDVELQQVFLPKAQRYDRLWRAENARIFPEWRDKPDLLECAIDFVQAALEGLVLNSPIWNNSTREAVFRAFLADIMRKLRDGELKLPTRRESEKFRSSAPDSEKTIPRSVAPKPGQIATQVTKTPRQRAK